MRRDRQHRGYRIPVLGIEVYPGCTRGENVYWKDLNNAVALVLKEDGAPATAGASTALLWLANWALDNLPAEYRERIRLKYLFIRAQKDAADKAAREFLDTPAP